MHDKFYVDLIMLVKSITEQNCFEYVHDFFGKSVIHLFYWIMTVLYLHRSLDCIQMMLPSIIA